MKKLIKGFLFNEDRKRMWKDAKKTIEKIDSSLNLSEIYVIGSFASKKKTPDDIDFVVVTKTSNKKSNQAYPVDLIVLPENEDTKEYLGFFRKWMKKKYGSSGLTKLK